MTSKDVHVLRARKVTFWGQLFYFIWTAYETVFAPRESKEMEEVLQREKDLFRHTVVGASVATLCISI